MRIVSIQRDFEEWRKAARGLLGEGVRPEFVLWEEAVGGGLLELGERVVMGGSILGTVNVPAEFVSLAKRVACHRDPGRWHLLYRTLYRLTHGERDLLSISVDDDVRRLELMDHSVRRDIHKMHAFVRFRKVERDGEEHYVAWHQPEHYTVKAGAPFFMKRFGGMKWSILTPDDCAHWDGEELTFTAGVERSAAPSGDELETLWKTYYSNIFNPARLKIDMMKREMPVKYWKAMPETELIPDLISKAPKRVEEMMAKRIDEYPTAAPFVPASHAISTLHEAANKCEGCPLYKNATQVVFGEGPRDAKVIFVGEQPGDQEDLAGRPFVGPAGQLFDRALEEIGIDRSAVYVTNAVKHFKWEPRGKRRLHVTPNAREISACAPWLAAEIGAIKPEVLVCLGATASQALMGREFRITKQRGQVFTDTPHAKNLVATIHPSAILRTPEESRDAAYDAFVRDLKVVLTLL